MAQQQRDGIEARKAQLVTLRAFVMLAVITVAIATFTAMVGVWPGP